mgnify:FL=1
MSYIKYFFLVFVLFFLSCQSQEKIRELEPNIFGFATSNTFTFCDIYDTIFTNQVININPQILRFPGGAVGNFYHFGKAGYGFDFEEIKKYHGGKFPKRSLGLEKYRKKKKHDHDYIDDFIFLAKLTKSSAVLVANPFTQTDDDIIDMIKKLHKNNINVIGVELGSELSNRSYFLKGYTINDYINFAERCSKNIKKSFPKIKTAIVAAPLGKIVGHRHNIWNEKLSKKSFYDAIIIHSYANVIKGKSLDGQMITENLDSKDPDALFDIFKARALKYLLQIYPKEVKNYYSIFKKPIWVTEWNLQISQTTGNTLFQALFVAHYLLECMSLEALSPIELTTYHNLGGRDIAGSIFRRNDEITETHSTYYPMLMIGKIFSNNITTIQRDFNRNIFTYRCFDINNIEKLVYTIDWDNFEFKCDDMSSKMLETSTFRSKNLYDIANKDGFLDYKVEFKND